MKKYCKVFILIFLVCQSVSALDFKITSVIEVGPIFGGAGMHPAQWSPDGTKLAYFNDGFLMISDTLGITQRVAEIDLSPRRFAWSSNTDIIFFQKEFLQGDTILERMSSINIESVDIEILENISRKRGEEHSREIWGPFKTVEGNVFYHLTINNTKSIMMVPNLQPEKASPKSNHILRAGENALYLVQSDFMDSIKISNEKAPFRHISNDKTHVLSGGTITRLKDHKYLVLDTISILQTKPEGTDGCDFGSESFNPKFTEVAFRYSCDDGDSYSVNSIGVFDYTTFQLTFLDPLMGLENCNRPSYAPDGKRLAFTSDGKVFILNREVSDE